MLQGMHRGILQPGRRLPRGQKRTVAPVGQLLGHRHVADKRATGIAVSLLQRQSLVEHEPAGAGEAAHLALLFAGRHQFVFEGLESLHGLAVWIYSIQYRAATRAPLTPRPKGRGLSRYWSRTCNQYQIAIWHCLLGDSQPFNQHCVRWRVGTHPVGKPLPRLVLLIESRHLDQPLLA